MFMQGKEYVSNRQSMKFSYLSILTAMTVMTNDNLFSRHPAAARPSPPSYTNINNIYYIYIILYYYT